MLLSFLLAASCHSLPIPEKRPTKEDGSLRSIERIIFELQRAKSKNLQEKTPSSGYTECRREREKFHLHPIRVYHFFETIKTSETMSEIAKTQDSETRAAVGSSPDRNGMTSLGAGGKDSSSATAAPSSPAVEPQNVVQNSFSAYSPYYSSYVENEMRGMTIMQETLRDIAARTKTFGKCGVLMSESTKRLALACRLRRPYVVEDESEREHIEQIHQMEVAERRRAVGDDMASLLSVMSEVSPLGGRKNPELSGGAHNAYSPLTCLVSVDAG